MAAGGRAADIGRGEHIAAERPIPAERRKLHIAPVLPTDMGTMRTIMAADRTLMAWIRTSLSMLSFGFTIYKFLEGAAQQNMLPRSGTPQDVGLFLAGMGTLSMSLDCSAIGRR